MTESIVAWDQDVYLRKTEKQLRNKDLYEEMKVKEG